MFESSINIRRLFVILLLGFSSGLPLALTGSTLQAWFTVSGADIVSIGLLSLVGQPYVYKFIWAPLFDRYTPPFLGRRRGWLLITQVLLLLAIGVMAFGDPQHHPMFLASMALLVAFLSASQDIGYDAYRTDVTAPQELGLSAALNSGGYRIAMIVSSGLALILAAKVGWHITYLVLMALMLVGIGATLLGEGPVDDPANNKRPLTLRAAVVEPFYEFLTRPGAILFLLLLLFYKFGDALSLSLSSVFLLRGLGFSLITVGTINKIFGTIASILGVFVGGAIMTRISLYRSLLWFGILQIVAIFFLMQLAIVGKNYNWLVVSIFADNLFNGMGTAALVALLMALCDHRYTAAQFALLTAFTSLARVFIGPVAGVMVKHIGWIEFFGWSILACLPGVFLVYYLRDRIQAWVVVNGSN